VASEFIDWLGIAGGARWLDVGCGTGTLVGTILARSNPASVAGMDRSEAYVAHARARITDTRAEFRAGDAQSLPYADNAFDAAVSGLVLNFVPDKEKAAREMARVVRPSGVVGVYVWDYAGEMQLMRRFWDAAGALDPAARELDEGRRFPICQPERLASLFGEAGLAATASRAIDVPTVFGDFDDYWTPFLGGQGPAPGYCMSLNESRRTALRERLRATLPAAGDGSLSLMARAFAIRGMRED
jgi:SAM-dependent methyltransferase